MRAPQLTPAERFALINHAEIMLQPYAGELKLVIVRQLKRLCFVNAGDRPVVEVVDACLKSDFVDARTSSTRSTAR